MVVLGYFEVILLREREDASLCPSVYWVLVIYGITVSEQYVVEFPGLSYFWGISSSPVAFLFLIFLSTVSSSSCVNRPSLMSSWLLNIFVIGSCLTFGGFPSKLPKCSFHRCIRSSWLVAFSLAFTSTIPSADFVYRLPCYPRLSIFFRVSNLIYLILYLFSLFF